MNQLLMFWNLQKAAVKTFARFALEKQWFWNQQEAAVNHVTLQFHCFIYKTTVRIEIMVTAVGVVDWFYL